MDLTYIEFTVDNETHYLLKQPDDKWLFTQRKPPLNDIEPITITFTEDDKQIIVNTDDELLGQTIASYIADKQTFTGGRMLSYYPYVIRKLQEYQVLIYTLGFEIDFLLSEVTLVLNDSYLLSMGEERLTQWEKALGVEINSEYSLEDRREVVIARLQNFYKLNTNAIADIVRVFTNNEAITYFENSCIYVKILVPADNKQYRFESVEKELLRRIPAHLKLSVTRNYASWQEIKNNFETWQTVQDNFKTWEDVFLYVAPITTEIERGVYYGNAND